MYARMCISCVRIYKVEELLEDDKLVCMPCRILEFTKTERFEIYTEHQKGKFFKKIQELYELMDKPDYLFEGIDEDKDDGEEDEPEEDYNELYGGPVFEFSEQKNQRLIEYFNSISFDEDFKIAGIPEEMITHWFYIQDFSDDDHENENPTSNIVEL